MSTERARELRRNPTVPERAMWRLLKPLRDKGFHFRRQVPIGSYYVDFAIHRQKLVIEVDGDIHGIEDGPMYDAERTRFLQNEGYRVLRFSNLDVLHNPEGVFETIEKILK